MQDSLDAANERGPGCLFQDLTQEVIKWQLIHLDISGSALTFLQFECLALTPAKLWILRIVIFFLQFNYNGGYVEVFVDGACLNNGRGGAQVH